MIIYEPTGKAREYSPLALNVYNGCDHGCRYCYVAKMFFAKRYDKPTPRKDIITTLKRELTRVKPDKQVLLSFMCDPYCNADQQLRVTREVLKVLCDHDVKTAILTKGGSRSLVDMDIIKKFKSIKIGATLTFENELDSDGKEPGAAMPSDRLSALEQFHNVGIKTFASMEPVIFPKQTISMIWRSLPYVDQYKIGKLNHYPEHEKMIDWSAFLEEVINILRPYKKDFYIKKDLRDKCPNISLTPQESDMDFLSLK